MSRIKKLINISIDASPEVYYLLDVLKKQRKLSQFISKSINMLFNYEYYNKGFLLEMIDRHYELCKHILRNIGSTKNKE